MLNVQGKISLMLWLSGLMCVTACSEKRPFLDDPDGRREVEETRTADDPLLQLLPASETGLDFMNTILETDDNNFYTNITIYNGGGVSVADFNNDGLQDLYFISSDGKNKLFLNEGNLKFRDITDQAGVGSEGGFETASVAVDINNDGWMDLYVCRGGMVGGEIRRNRLFVNNGDLSFSEQSKQYGIDDWSACTGANFFDYDNDGDLDLYLVNQPSSTDYDNNLEAVLGEDGKTMIPINKPKADYDSDQFYRNNGDNTFSNVSQEAGIWNSGYGLSTAVSDLNRDGLPDIYVSNDFVRPDFYYTNNGDGTFTDRLQESFRHICKHTMGSDLTDFDNDGLVDLYSVDMLPMSNYRLKSTRVTVPQASYSATVQSGYYEQIVRNMLQRNNGDGTFSEVGCLANVFQTEWSWSNLLFDIDNDGLRDIYVSNGYRRNLNDADFFDYKFDEISKVVDPYNLKTYFGDIQAFIRLIPTYKSRNCCFQNQGNWQFAEKSGDWLTVPASWSNGTVWTDLDNDGDLDIVVNNLEDKPFVYKNLASEKRLNNFLQVRLKGSAKNINAIGASAIIYYGNQKQYIELNPVRGIFSSVEYLMHFGLGKVATIDRLIVRWPDGKTQTLTNVPANQRLELSHKDASGYTVHLAPLQPVEKFFRKHKQEAGFAFQHTENNFNDFESWPLNLFKESELGPFFATGDVNGDGLEDVFIGNAFDQPAALYKQMPSGQFSAISTQTWLQDKIYEDHGAVFFDADQDGDLDLYVVSGGMEAVSEQAWQDRLYLNDGTGNFSRAPDALPVIKTVGQKVIALDYDQDGDQDLLVGGRVSGGKWPLTPRSLVLQNDGSGHFTDQTTQAAPDFEHCGMITDMCLIDLDGDSKPELIVCGEWMPIMVFRLDGKQVILDKTERGFRKSEGIWSSIHAGDLDGDGDLDLITGNLGLNSRLAASSADPLLVFAGDFDDNGTLDPIVTYRESGKNLPLAQKNVMHKQLPKVKKKFLYSRDYSMASIEEIFSPSELENALKLAANTLETCWWENQSGHFVKRSFPVQAQIAPVNSVLCADFTGDGTLDVLLAGNKYGLEVETNRLDGGNGVLLKGTGGGRFSFVENHQSGFWASYEVRDMVSVPGQGERSTILVSNNNGPVQAYLVQHSSNIQ
ncbi:MAG: hypothetical protein EP344_07645 [Bacteroidetes bacterium]|nr:MAG: hypothetical protein EP344_07645 [Bacteroidota bacterium]